MATPNSSVVTGPGAQVPAGPVAVSEDLGARSSPLSVLLQPSNLDRVQVNVSGSTSRRPIVAQLLPIIERECAQNLSPLAKELIRSLPEMRRLDSIPNSAMAYTDIFGHLNFSRGRHSIDAAAQVAKLKLPLSNHERAVLEIALLFHDIGHVPGSHAMDKVFASMRGAPPIGEWGYGREEYHELHGAELVGSGPSSPRIRSLCGEVVFGDVMAVLTHEDRRLHFEKVQTYGHFKPNLPEDRVSILSDLKDRLDRTSYLKFDYLLGGYDNARVGEVVKAIERYHGSLFLTEKGVATTDAEAYQKIIDARGWHFEHVPSHPTNGLISAVMQQALWQEVQRQGYSQEYLQSPGVYQDIRQKLLGARYAEVFGRETWAWFRKGGQCVTNFVAPIATLKMSDLTESGRLAVKKIRDRDEVIAPDRAFPAGLVTAVCGAPIYDASPLELEVQGVLKQRSKATPLFFVYPVQHDKAFPHLVATNGDLSQVEQQSFGYSSPSQAEGRVVIAARAYSPEDGRIVDLATLAETVRKVLTKRGWVKDGSIGFEPRIFVKPHQSAIFDSDIQNAMSALNPQWLKESPTEMLERLERCWGRAR